MTNGTTTHHPNGEEVIPCVPFYLPPKQLQRWGDTQLLPHVNWGDLFFDLFYVGAAYNLGNLLRYERSSRGVMYFAGLFGAVSKIWFDRLTFDSRFNVGDDIFHRIYEVFFLSMLATSVVNIQTVEDLENSQDSSSMFSFCLGMTVLTFLDMLRQLEIIKFVNTPEAKPTAKRELRRQFPSLILYLVATIIAGVDFYHADNDHYEKYRQLANETATYDSSSRRNDVPIILCIVSFVLSYINIWLHIFSKLAKENTIPMNVGFVIHRHGEFTMLFLGESVLSLLIVEVTNEIKYYVTFYSGLASVIALQYLHFKSQPHHADEHAMRQSKVRGVSFFGFFMIYCASLIALGATYKMLLYEYTIDNADERGRMMAASDNAVYADKEDRLQRTANLFSGSMTLTCTSLDMMSVVHKGIFDNLERCSCPKTQKIYWSRVFFVILRLGLLIFMATLSQWMSGPEELAFVGLLALLGQIITRFLGLKVFPTMKKVHAAITGEDHHNFKGQHEVRSSMAYSLNQEDKWPNVTSGNAESPNV